MWNKIKDIVFWSYWLGFMLLILIYLTSQIIIWHINNNGVGWIIFMVYMVLDFFILVLIIFMVIIFINRKRIADEFNRKRAGNSDN